MKPCIKQLPTCKSSASSSQTPSAPALHEGTVARSQLAVPGGRSLDLGVKVWSGSLNSLVRVVAHALFLLLLVLPTDLVISEIARSAIGLMCLTRETTRPFTVTRSPLAALIRSLTHFMIEDHRDSASDHRQDSIGSRSAPSMATPSRWSTSLFTTLSNSTDTLVICKPPQTIDTIKRSEQGIDGPIH